MKVMHWLLLGSGFAITAACASAPVHYHTLVPDPVDSPAMQRPSSRRIEIAAVRIPAQVDRAELVVRQRNGQIALLENELWIAPLSNELRGALTIELVRRLSVAEEQDPGRGQEPITVHIDIERFESAPGQYALVEAFWRLRIKSLVQENILVCRTSAYERVPEGYDALVRAHQHAVALIADEIAVAATQSTHDGIAVCPVAGDPH